MKFPFFSAEEPAADPAVEAPVVEEPTPDASENDAPNPEVAPAPEPAPEAEPVPEVEEEAAPAPVDPGASPPLSSAQLPEPVERIENSSPDSPDTAKQLGYEPSSVLPHLADIFAQFEDAAKTWSLPIEWLRDSIIAGHALPHEDYREAKES